MWQDQPHAQPADEESLAWAAFLKDLRKKVFEEPELSNHLHGDVQAHVLEALETLAATTTQDSGGVPRFRVVLCTCVVKRGWQLRVALIVNMILAAAQVHEARASADSAASSDGHEAAQFSIAWMLALAVDGEDSYFEENPSKNNVMN